jgi:aspartyl-tRNA(Asn)/glutamyl-tRNA(Gln) amidotransferase subunit A
MHAFMHDYDLLVMPTLPVTAFEVGELAPTKSGGEQWIDWTPWTYPFNLSRQPAATVPCGVCGNGLPAGLQIIGSLHDEETVLRAAAAFETARPWELPPMATA